MRKHIPPFFFIFVLVLGFAFLPESWASTSKDSTDRKTCTAAKEYVTSLEFLRNQKAMEIPEAQARDFASQVAKGCNGASQRFIKVVAVLMKAGLGTRDALNSGVEYAQLDAAAGASFTHIFNRAFLAEYLDLDARTAFKMANSLSRLIDADQREVANDFSRLSDFCSKEESLDLPKPMCATMAARIAALGNSWGGGVSRDFINTFEFLKSKKGPGMTTGNALKLAEEIIAFGQSGPNNFNQAYRYATSKSGLALPAGDAIQFAKKLASYQPDADDSKEHSTKNSKKE